MPRTIPSVERKGGVSVTSAPLQTALMTDSLSSTVEQAPPPGSSLPLYLYPLLPAGLPSPVHPSAPRTKVALPAPSESVSKKRSSAPAVVGSSGELGTGREKPVELFETNFASLAGLAMLILAEIRTSAADPTRVQPSTAHTHAPTIA